MKSPLSFARKFSNHRRRAFTRVELLAVVIAAALLLAVVVVPALAATKADSGRIACFNNLRLVGRAVLTWTSDHNQQFSWRTQFTDGGTGSWPQVKPGNAWYEFAAFSNELVTPKILACPSDTGVRAARHFGWESDGGFMSQPYRNNSVSYSLNLDGSLDVPRSWLSGDRNFQGSFPAGNCSAYVNNTYAIPIPQNSFLQWTNSVHGASGHMLTTDGSVEFTYTPRLKEIILQSGMDDNGQVHFLKAR